MIESIDNANDTAGSITFATAPMDRIDAPPQVSKFLKLTVSSGSSEETMIIECQKGSLKSMTV